MKATFRSYKRSEENHIRKLIWKLNREDTEELPLTDKKIDDVFYLIHKDPLAKIFVCLVDKKIVGFSMFFTCLSLEYGGLWGVIESLYIEPVFRGKGLGIKFLQWIENYSKKKNYKVLYIEATAGNTRAQKLYEKFGFKEFPWKYYLKTL